MDMSFFDRGLDNKGRFDSRKSMLSNLEFTFQMTGYQIVPTRQSPSQFTNLWFS